MRPFLAIVGTLGACLLLLAGGSAATSASTANARMYWGQGIAAVLPANAATGAAQPDIESVSCASPGNCSAVGTYLDGAKLPHGLLLTERAGRWSRGVEAHLPADADAAAAEGLSIESVSCSSAGNCGAVGEYTDDAGNLQGLLLTETAGTWATGVEAALPADATTTGQLVLLASVSCPSDGNCSAVGEYNVNSDAHGVLLTSTAGTWATGTEATMPGDGEILGFSSVSCASAGNCSAVGEYNDTSDDLQGVMLTETAGVWAAGVEAALPANAAFTPGGVYLTSVSCASPGNCAAVGRYNDGGAGGDGLLLTEKAGTWEAGVEAVPPANAAPEAVQLNAVSCDSAGSCAAVGDYTDDSANELGLVLSETSGVWSDGVGPALPANATAAGQEAALYSVSCPSAGSCSAVGEYSDKSEDQQGLLLTETAGRWHTGVAAALPSNVNRFSSYSVQLLSVSCPSARYCTGVGSYSGGSDSSDGLLLDGSPTPPCVVPELKHGSLVVARRAIKSHDCSVGEIRHARSRAIKQGHVISQSPRPGEHLKHGAKVSLVVSQGR